MPPERRAEVDARRDIGALLPGVGVFGGVRRFLALGNELVRRGHAFTLYHPDGSQPEWMPYEGAVERLEALAHREHEVLLCSDPALLDAFAAARARLKLFYCVLEKMPREREVVRYPGWRLVANSSGLRARLWRRYGVCAEAAVGGVDLQCFRASPAGVPPTAPPPTARGSPPRSRLPEGTTPLRLLAYGRFSRARKGARLLVRAAEILQRRLANPPQGTAPRRVHLVMFDHLGPGNDIDPREHLENCAVDWELHLNLAQDALAALYRSCDVFVNAERRAGWNNTVAEAMASGVPVVCTPSGTRDIARHRETAWVCRWRHPECFARGLQVLAGDPPLRHRLARAASRRILDFAWPRVADALEEILDRYRRTATVASTTA